MRVAVPADDRQGRADRGAAHVRDGPGRARRVVHRPGRSRAAPRRPARRRARGPAPRPGAGPAPAALVGVRRDHRGRRARAAGGRARRGVDHRGADRDDHQPRVGDGRRERSRPAPARPPGGRRRRAGGGRDRRAAPAARPADGCGSASPDRRSRGRRRRRVRRRHRRRPGVVGSADRAGALPRPRAGHRLRVRAHRRAAQAGRRPAPPRVGRAVAARRPLRGVPARPGVVPPQPERTAARPPGHARTRRRAARRSARRPGERGAVVR